MGPPANLLRLAHNATRAYSQLGSYGIRPHHVVTAPQGPTSGRPLPGESEKESCHGRDTTRSDRTGSTPRRKHFGATGAYEVLKGRLTFRVDPAHPRNRDITDIGRAEGAASGHVEWWADFCLLQPADPTRSNNRLFFEAVNRGRIRAFRMLDP